jgi:hypothetical protein
MRPISYRQRICSIVAPLIISTFAVGAPGEVSIVGTGDGIDIFRALAVAFMEENKSIWIDVPPSIGSSGGVAAVGKNMAVLGGDQNVRFGPKASIAAHPS